MEKIASLECLKGLFPPLFYYLPHINIFRNQAHLNQSVSQSVNCRFHMAKSVRTKHNERPSM